MGRKLTDERSAEEPGVLGVDIESFYITGMPMILVISYGRMTIKRISGTEHSIIAIRNYMKSERTAMSLENNGSVTYTLP
jgi:hypothetical protein